MNQRHICVLCAIGGKMYKNEKRERVLSLWLQNVPEEAIATVMGMTVKEVHKSIYMPSYQFIIHAEQKE